jgi:lipopolysaccharide export system permease protein
MQFMWRYIEDFVGKGLNFGVIIELIFYISISLIPMALPLAILLASLMTFGNLGESYELSAIKSAGISLQKVMKPLIFLTILISISAFYFSNHIIPYSHLKMKTLIKSIQRQKPEFQLKEGAFYNGIDGYSIRIGNKSNSGNMLYSIRIYDHTEKRGNVKVTVADSGTMIMTKDEQNMIVTLYDGYNYTEVAEKVRRQEKSYPHRREKFKKQELIMDLTGFGLHRLDEQLFKSDYKVLNIYQLNTFIDSINNFIDVRRNEFHHTIIASNYFKNRIIQDSMPTFPQTIEIDTINPVYRDKIFTSLKPDMKMRVLRSAINSARRSKEYISITSGEFERRFKSLYRYEIEWHRKFTLSFACLIFFFIGAPMGAIIRKGGFGLPIVVSVVLFIFYYIITLTGEKFVKELMMLPYQGMWIPSLILLPVGILLTYQATTDSVLMNMDAYRSFFTKINIFKRNFPVEKKFIGSYASPVEKTKILKKLTELKAITENRILEMENILKHKNILRFTNSNVLVDKVLFKEYCILYNSVFHSLVIHYTNHSKIVSKLNDLPRLIYINYQRTLRGGIITIMTMVFILLGILQNNAPQATAARVGTSILFILIIIIVFFVTKNQQMIKLRNTYRSIHNTINELISTIEFEEAQ